MSNSPRFWQRLIAVIRSPDDAKIKQKMVFASSRDALRRAFVGVAVEIQATDYDEVSFENGGLSSTLYNHPCSDEASQFWTRLAVVLKLLKLYFCLNPAYCAVVRRLV